MEVHPESDARDPRQRLLRALGDGGRLALLDVLSRGEASVGALVTHLGIPQPLVSRHLRILREAGWLSDERRGQRVYYRLNPEAVRCIQSWISQLPTALAPPLHLPTASAVDATPGAGPGVLFVD